MGVVFVNELFGSGAGAAGVGSACVPFACPEELQKRGLATREVGLVVGKI